jgi:hypothetical protein
MSNVLIITCVEHVSELCEVFIVIYKSAI